MHDLVCSLNFPFEYNGILPDVTPMQKDEKVIQNSSKYVYVKSC
jgi:hypothetical protein